MRQIAFPQLLLINVVIDINGFPSQIASKLLDEFAGHASAPEMSCNQCLQQCWLK